VFDLPVPTPKPKPPVLLPEPPAPVVQPLRQNAPEDREIFPPPEPPKPLPPKPIITPPQQTAAHPPAQPVRRIPTVRQIVWLTLALTLSATAFGIYHLSHQGPDGLTIELDRKADNLGVRTDRRDMLVVADKELLTISREGKVISRQRLDIPIASIRWEKGSAWTVDGRSATLVERRETGRPTVYQLNHVPSALYINGNFLWTLDKAGKTIHQYLISRSILGAMLQPLDIYALPNLKAESFFVDETGILWTTDSDSRELIQLKAEAGHYKAISKAPLSPFLGPDGIIQGLTLEDGGVWLLSSPTEGGHAKLRFIPLSRLDWANPS
jgi:hypothetical protein